MSKEIKDITFEDVELAIKVLQRYIVLSRRAEAILKIATRTQSKRINPMGMSFEDFVNIAMQMKQREQTQEPEPEIQFDEKDLEKIEKIKEKLKSSQQ
jgi:mannose/fructose/N-acetylgalactosamine-specific phosphotransferase system component IIB